MQKIESTQAATTAENLANMAGQNPANPPEKPAGDRVRVPMTTPTRKLEVAELPGFWLQWIRGTPDRVMQAKAAFFEHVTESEIHPNNHDLGGDARTSGNTDMGTIVSTTDGSGEIGADGQGVRMYLMKQRKEYHDEDMAINQRRNDSVVDSLTSAFRHGTVGVGAEGAPAETSDDLQKRYVKPDLRIPEIFRRKPNKA